MRCLKDSNLCHCFYYICFAKRCKTNIIEICVEALVSSKVFYAFLILLHEVKQRKFSPFLLDSATINFTLSNNIFFTDF